MTLREDRYHRERDEARVEVALLKELIDSAGKPWLALLLDHPIQWEGAIDSAMAAACDEIKRLKLLVQETQSRYGKEIDKVVAELTTANAVCELLRTNDYAKNALHHAMNAWRATQPKSDAQHIDEVATRKVVDGVARHAGIEVDDV